MLRVGSHRVCALNAVKYCAGNHNSLNKIKKRPQKFFLRSFNLDLLAEEEAAELNNFCVRADFFNNIGNCFVAILNKGLLY